MFRSVVLGEEELGQAAPQTMCFITRFVKNEFITSDAMSKLRQVSATPVSAAHSSPEPSLETFHFVTRLKRSLLLWRFLV